MSPGGKQPISEDYRPRNRVPHHRAIKFVTKSAANLTLLCFPHGGAGASTYFPWMERLRGQGIELVCAQYPGREERIAEPAGKSIGEIADEIADAWTSLGAGRNCAFFGHSMGAAIALEVLIRLPEHAKRTISHLVVSGKNAPHLPSRLPSIGDLSDDMFLQEVQRRYGEMRAELLSDPQMRELIVEILRGDLRAIEAYIPSVITRLPIPITVFSGEQDPCTDSVGLFAWSHYTRAEIRLHQFPGGHFFHQTEQNDVVSKLVSELARHPVQSGTYP